MKGQLKVKAFAAQCALVVGMMGSANVAVGATAYSSASIDWSTLSWSTSPGVNLFWDVPSLFVESEVEILQSGVTVGYDYDSAGGGSGGVSVNAASGPDLYGQGTSSGSKAEAESAADVFGDESFAYAGREGLFWVDAATDVTFTVDYELMAIVGTDLGAAYSNVEFELENINTLDYTWDDDSAEQEGVGFVLPFGGTFTLTMSFDAFDVGYVYGGVSTTASNVPEPGVLPLLGLGLLGVWGASRRRSA